MGSYIVVKPYMECDGGTRLVGEVVRLGDARAALLIANGYVRQPGTLPQKTETKPARKRR